MNFYEYLEKRLKKDGIKKIVVGAIIVNDNNEVLLVRRKQDDFMGGFYEIPGGNSEENETIYETLIREVKEETNFDIEKVISYVNYFDYISDSGKKSRQFNFVVNVKSIDNLILTEHDCYKWVNLNKLEEIDNISDEVRECLLIYRFNSLC